MTTPTIDYAAAWRALTAHVMNPSYGGNWPIVTGSMLRELERRHPAPARDVQIAAFEKRIRKLLGRMEDDAYHIERLNVTIAVQAALAVQQDAAITEALEEWEAAEARVRALDQALMHDGVDGEYVIVLAHERDAARAALAAAQGGEAARWAPWCDAFVEALTQDSAGDEQGDVRIFPVDATMRFRVVDLTANRNDGSDEGDYTYYAVWEEKWRGDHWGAGEQWTFDLLSDAITDAKGRAMRAAPDRACASVTHAPRAVPLSEAETRALIRDEVCATFARPLLDELTRTGLVHTAVRVFVTRVEGEREGASETIEATKA